MSSVTTELVRHFNDLPRPALLPEGDRNYYHFAAKPLPITLNARIITGDVVFIVNPYDIQYCSEGRTKTLRLFSDEQAKIIVSLLLEAFVNTFNGPVQAFLPMGTTREPIAPFTWSTTDQRLAQATSCQCQAIGIRHELCNVSVSNAVELHVAELA
ncbi:hypothetical protein N7475_010186 [Penicillium sp. IBT 31633x]|nr:hypothetical protein N7475_010186 [Penicillium sp. IBT 31633x]